MLTETKRVENHDRVVELLNSVERDGISDLLKWLEESDFFTAPASRAYHGAYIGGLCEHSLNMSTQNVEEMIDKGSADKALTNFLDEFTITTQS